YIRLNHLDSNYNIAWETLMNFSVLDKFHSYYQVKMKTTELSGIEPVIRNMCIDLCVGFTGPFSDLSHCPKCGESCYNAAVLWDTQGAVQKPHK
ncbi:hypothetical protein J3A83DRAFT_4114232, partial [Scleroderma citrinum]